MTDADSVQVLLSLLAPEALLPLVSGAYDLEAPLRCRLLSSNDNDHYLVTAGPARHVARIYPRSKHWLENESDYRFELDWLSFLHERGLPVAWPIRRRDGGFLGALNAPEGLRYWALFSFAPGRPGLEEAQSAVYGRSVAEIHRVSNDFHSPHRRVHFDLERLAERPVRQIRNWLGDDRPEDVACLERLAEELAEEVRSAGMGGDEYGIIGGDFHGGNHHFTTENQLTHFDFDRCGYGWRAYDLAVFRCSAGSKPEIWNGFLEGYQSYRPLSQREIALIPVFSQLRHIWWMGSHTTYPAAASWLTDRTWDHRFQRLREMNQAWRERGI